MPSFMVMDDEMLDVVTRVLERHFDKLSRAEPEIRFAWLMAAGLKRYGVDVPWKTRVTNDEQRAVAGSPDVVVVLDVGEWRSRKDERTRESIAFDALHSIVPLWVNSTSSEVRTDGHDRPKIKLREPDVFAFGYRKTVETYRKSAPLYMSLVTAAAALEQLVLGFDGAGGPLDLFPQVTDVTDAKIGEKEEDAARALVRDTFAALLVVGNTEEQARQAMDRSAAGNITTVSQWVEAVYRLPPLPAKPTESGHYAAEADTVPAGLVACTRCNLLRPARPPAAGCPDCACPEYRVSPTDVAEAEAAAAMKKAAKKSKRGAATVPVPPPDEDGLFLAYRNGRKMPLFAVRAASLADAVAFAKAQQPGESMKAKPDDGTAKRLGLMVRDATPAGSAVDCG
jgi:hypothetical protein